MTDPSALQPRFFLSFIRFEGELPVAGPSVDDTRVRLVNLVGEVFRECSVSRVQLAPSGFSVALLDLQFPGTYVKVPNDPSRFFWVVSVLADGSSRFRGDAREGLRFVHREVLPMPLDVHVEDR